jgi:hypothetical protein
MTRLFLTLLLSLLALAACNQSEPATVGSFRPDAVKIEVAESGFHRLTAGSLKTAGLDVAALSAQTVQLRQGATAVPFLIDDGDLIFYGQAPDNRYTAVRPYLLELGKAGVVMTETAVSPGDQPTLAQLPVTLRLEQNNIYEATALPFLPPAEQDNSYADLWFWQKLDLQQDKVTIPLDLTAVADGSAALMLNLWGQSENAQITADHDLDVVVNGQTAATVRWDGRQFYRGQLALPSGSLQSGENSLILDNEVPGASFLDIMLFNWLELTYLAEPVAVNDLLQFGGVTGQVTLTGFSQRPLLFDIQDPANPRLLTGWTFAGGAAQLSVSEAMVVTAVAPPAYLAPAAISPVRASDWGNPQQQADLLIVTTDELAPALAPLVEARQAQGLSVAVVPVTEIYDAFGQGEATPASITAFVKYALENWQQPRPRYLFLVGEATADYRNYLGQAPANLIPSPMVPVQYSGETVSDSRLADVDGDQRPDLAIGRWPVSTVAEVDSLVARTLAYEAGTADTRAIFATDGTESHFATMAQRLADAANLTIELFPGARANEVAAQFNQGAWLATYIGHGSTGQWGKEDVFTLDAVSQLASTTPSIVLQLTCLTGLFAHPQAISLSERMLTHEGGPVLIIAATSLTLSAHQEPFAAALLQNLQAPDLTRIGDAFQEAKLSLPVEGDSGLREISDTFVLLGDPSAKIVRPSTDY